MNRKRKRTTTLSLPLFLIGLAIAAFVWFKQNSRPVNPDNPTKQNFTIQKGETIDSIGERLKDAGLIRSTRAFRIEVMVSGISKGIQAGDFAIPLDEPLPVVVRTLTQGTTDRWVTFLEGWRREEFAQALVDQLSPDNPDFAFSPDEFLNLTEGKEGMLAPDTYSFPRDTTAQLAADRLIEQYNTQIADLENNSGLSDYQALILASLIEREALHNDERPIIAGILLKRLNNDWPLQVDATVQYVKANNSCPLLTCDWWPQNITKDDIALESAYNTYAQPGLPPAPISSPSLTTIKAAYNPESSPYWFYLHDLSGTIHYGKTIEEHNSNIAKYL